MKALKEKTFVTHSAEETIRLGAKLAAGLEPPRLVLLVGDLGSGKTTLVKGILRGLRAASEEDVLSPTFSLIHEYEGPPKVYHVDLYRLDRLPELETLGLDDVWDECAIVLIEWGEKFAEQLPGRRTEIYLQDLGGDDREIRVKE